jgi:dolichyl-phosphate-mannose--protein O-mannosyl transferase
MVFDETHFGGFLSDYLRGICFFDIHPPLAKLMMAAMGKISGYDGSFNFSEFGADYTSDFYVPLRALPCFCSTMVSPILTAALLLKNIGLVPSYMVGYLMATEFTCVVQGRLILTDGILYFFVALTILSVALMEWRQEWKWLILQAFASACCLSIKFTGASVLILVAFSNFRILFGQSQWFFKLSLRGIVVFLVNVSFLVLTVYIHLIAMPNPGFGDRYMAANFRGMPMPRRIYLLIKAMYDYNKNLGFTHPYQSKWYEWPFCLEQPLFLWLGGQDPSEEMLFLFNNPIATYGSVVGFIVGFTSWDIGYSLGYLLSYLPFILVSRCTFSYHYEISLMFGLMALCQAIGRFKTKRRLWTRVCLVIMGASLGAFLWYFPWLYGTKMSRKNHMKKMIWTAMKKAWEAQK